MCIEKRIRLGSALCPIANAAEVTSIAKTAIAAPPSQQQRQYRQRAHPQTARSLDARHTAKTAVFFPIDITSALGMTRPISIHSI